jgi:putative restriction endonuclease
MFDRTQDSRVRAAAFEWLSGQVAIHGDVLPRSILAQGFILDGDRIPLVGPQGIFKPRVLSDAPLSITTAPEGPYDDEFGTDRLLRYRYRGTNRDHADNRGLRFAMERRLPLIYFHGIVPGKYMATWPVFVVKDNPAKLFFSVAVDDAAHMALGLDQNETHGVVSEDSMARRAYITAAVRQRLHQRAFRERVLNAYRHQCSFCRLRHEELLDAAHIIGDTEPMGEPVVRNGLSLCKLHHAAFDNHFVGLRPDYVLEVRRDILQEHDGPTLVYAIQALHGASITLPRQLAQQPSRELLEIRYERFRQLSS